MALSLPALVRRPVETVREGMIDLRFQRAVARFQRVLASDEALDILGSFSVDRTLLNGFSMEDVDHILNELDAGTRRVEAVLILFEQRVIGPIQYHATLILDELKATGDHRRQAEDMERDAHLSVEERQYAFQLKEACDDMQIGLQVAYVRIGVKALVLLEIVERVRQLLNQRSLIRDSIRSPLERQRRLEALGRTIEAQRDRVETLVRFSDSGVDALVGAASPAVLKAMRILIERDEALIDATQLVAETGRSFHRPLSALRLAQLGSGAARESVELFASMMGDGQEVLSRLRKVLDVSLPGKDLDVLGELLDAPEGDAGSSEMFERVRDELEPRLRGIITASVRGEGGAGEAVRASKANSERQGEDLRRQFEEKLEQMGGYTRAFKDWFVSFKQNDLLLFSPDFLVNIIRGFSYDLDVIRAIFLGDDTTRHTPFSDEQLAVVMQGFLDSKTYSLYGSVPLLFSHVLNHPSRGPLTEAVLVHPSFFHSLWDGMAFHRPADAFFSVMIKAPALLERAFTEVVPSIEGRMRWIFMHNFMCSDSLTPEVAARFYGYYMEQPPSLSAGGFFNVDQARLLLRCPFLSPDQVQALLDRVQSLFLEHSDRLKQFELATLSNPNGPAAIREKYRDDSDREVLMAFARNPVVPLERFEEWLEKGYFSNINLVEQAALHPNAARDFFDALVQKHPQHLCFVVHFPVASLALIKTFLRDHAPKVSDLTAWLCRDDLDEVVLNNMAPYVGVADVSVVLSFFRYPGITDTSLGLCLDAVDNQEIFYSILENYQISTELKCRFFDRMVGHRGTNVSKFYTHVVVAPQIPTEVVRLILSSPYFHFFQSNPDFVRMLKLRLDGE